MTQRSKVSNCCWKNAAYRLALMTQVCHRPSICLKKKKAVSANCNEARYACISLLAWRREPNLSVSLSTSICTIFFLGLFDVYIQLFRNQPCSSLGFPSCSLRWNSVTLGWRRSEKKAHLGWSRGLGGVGGVSTQQLCLQGSWDLLPVTLTHLIGQSWCHDFWAAWTVRGTDQMLVLSLFRAFHSHDKQVLALMKSRPNWITVSLSVFDGNQPKLKWSGILHWWPHAVLKCQRNRIQASPRSVNLQACCLPLVRTALSL